MKAVNQSIGTVNEVILMTADRILKYGCKQCACAVLCPKEERFVTVGTIPPLCCATDVTPDPPRSLNFRRGSKIAPPRTQRLALLLLRYER